jgi:hypothetical protein
MIWVGNLCTTFLFKSVAYIIMIGNKYRIIQIFFRLKNSSRSLRELRHLSTFGTPIRIYHFLF